MKESAVAIIQARMSSTRLPGKVMADLGGMPMIEFMVNRVSKSRLLKEIIIAIPNTKADDELAFFCKKKGFNYFRGSEKDVLDRYVGCLEKTSCKIILRLTADCPFMDSDLIDKAIDIFTKKSVDYVSNINPPSFPDGLDIEVFSRQVLLKASENCKNLNEREHVTTWMRNIENCSSFNFSYSSDLSNLRWTVDEISDLKVVENVVSHFGNTPNFSWRDILNLFEKKPEIFSYNKHLVRNQGSKMGTGQKLWGRAKKVIPGGNMLLSKRSELFLPDQWPSYFSKSKGCNVWDLDNKKLIDCSIMSAGTNILGYANDSVDLAVKENIDNGTMSTLNCPEEVYLAEKLVEMHEWSDMVRFARTGGEANSIAIRIARAASGKDTVAICGYHGWHDWYIAANINNDSKLQEHLLDGLKANGVPKNLSGTIKPFSYNNFKQFNEIVNNHDIAAVKMEVQRSAPPENNFLQHIRNICTEKNIVLIFDECTSGFRENFGGLHKKYQIEPDMAVFGKALGNGYPITAVIGKENIMQSAQESFISSTFWTERIGPTAALKTLEIMEEMRSWEYISSIGKRVKNTWLKISQNNNIDIAINGLDALANFTFKSENHLLYKTLLTQEMLKRGFLATTGFFASTAHDSEIIEKYSNALNDVFGLIKMIDNGEKNIDSLLCGPGCHSGFKRLN